jgi:hypothetical protein
MTTEMYNEIRREELEDDAIKLRAINETASKRFREVIGYVSDGIDSTPREIMSPDEVNHPKHYTKGEVECIDAIKSAVIGKQPFQAVCVSQVIKYLWRYEEKGGLQSIEKAQWYLNKLIESESK